MITSPCHRSILIVSGLFTLGSGAHCLFADDNQISEQKQAAFQAQLAHIDPAFAGGPTINWKRDYKRALGSRETWQRFVKADGDQKARTSRAAETIAFSGQYKVEPVEVAGLKFPVKSNGGGYKIFVYRPVQKLQDGKWVALPDAVRQRRYLLVRGPAPREFDPYDIVACSYLGGLTEQQIVQLVNKSREF